MNPSLYKRGNLWHAAEAPTIGEHFQELARIGFTQIERIVSSDLPSRETYDQPQTEWVALLRGEALLEIEGEPLQLRSGDYLLLPAHTRHRVLETTRDALWLAVHVSGSRP